MPSGAQRNVDVDLGGLSGWVLSPQAGDSLVAGLKPGV